MTKRSVKPIKVPQSPSSSRSKKAEKSTPKSHSHPKIFTFRNFLSLISIILMIVVLYFNWSDILEAIEDLGQTDPAVLLLLIPEQLLMYFACGKIFFSYFRAHNGLKVKNSEIFRVSNELNFVSRALPAGTVSGLAFTTWRFKFKNIPAGETTFIYFFRFVITTIFNYLQCLLAVLILLSLGAVPDSAIWIVWLATLMNLGILLLFGIGFYIIKDPKRLEKVAKFLFRVVNKLVKTLTFGKKSVFLTAESIERYCRDLSAAIAAVRSDKKSLIGPILWGITYSFLEVAVYWIVAISMGEPGLLPVIMVGEAIGSALDGIVPYGLYELGMAGIMVALGTDVGTAAVITVVARVFSLLFSVIIGFFPYHDTIRNLGKEENV